MSRVCGLFCFVCKIGNDGRKSSIDLKFIMLEDSAIKPKKNAIPLPEKNVAE